MRKPRSQDLEARVSVAVASRLSLMRQSARERETRDTQFTRDTVTRVTIDWDEPQTPVGARKDSFVLPQPSTPRRGLQQMGSGNRASFLLPQPSTPHRREPGTPHRWEPGTPRRGSLQSYAILEDEEEREQAGDDENEDDEDDEDEDPPP